jgi:Kef-type K+ transport system membrane component KefB
MLVLALILIGFTFPGSMPENPAAAERYTVAQGGISQSHADRAPAEASGEMDHEHQILQFMVSIVLILIAAKFGGEIFERLGQPAVLGELLVGVGLGNVHLLGPTVFEALKTDVGIGIAAEVGVVLLLFQVGLETRLDEMKRVGISSLLVALLGVAAPMALGFVVGETLLPNHPPIVYGFLGATLAATSIGITARVMKDLGKTQTGEARIILGAAVIDDVIGLIILAVVSGLVVAAERGAHAAISPVSVSVIVLKAVAFFAVAILLGRFGARPALNTLSRMRVHGVLLAASIGMCFTLAAVAGWLGLAPIVGAFAAGLVLEPSHYRRFTRRGERSVDELIAPIADLFVPVFFVLMGLSVDLRHFASPKALGLAGALFVAAMVGKLVCGIGITQKGINRMIVSVGMIPRGEVGLIFASVGARHYLQGEPVIDAVTYSAIVAMVMLTTLITPIWLKSLFTKAHARKHGAAAG